jgi:thioredoxin 1
MSMTMACTKALLTRSILRPTTVRYMSVINLSTQDAVEKFTVMNSKSILYFTATWCPPCRQIKPIYESLAKDSEGIAFGKVDVDDNADAAAEYAISAVPTFVGLDGEHIVARFSGADVAQLETLVKTLQSK